MGGRWVIRLVAAASSPAMLLVAVGIAASARAADDPASHWAFAPLRTAETLAPGDDLAAAQAIDRLIDRQIHARALTAAPPAGPATLLRRLTFVLTGLPPTLEQQQRFLADPSPAAYAALVDELLGSHEFAERWGRHWLDVARFAESSGGGRSMMFAEAWRYRDYVIDAIDRDLPFDRFIVEQLAGDLLPANSPEEHDRLQIATGFLALGAINYELQDKALLNMEVVDEQIEATGRAFLGLSLGCARCHDHKFDPVSQAEYYSLAGFFTSTHTVVHANVGSPRKVQLQAAHGLDEYHQAQQHLAQLEQQLEQLKARLAENDLPDKQPELEAEIAEREKALAKAKKTAPKPPMAIAVADAESVGDTHVRIAGDVELCGDLAPRDYLPIANPDAGAIAIPAGQSGRLQLAEWIASPDNRLTSRVIVNRVWHYAMGEGLVRTPDDFGTTGTPPTHPELLDHLAAQFTEQGWSIKTLVRQIVLTEAFRRDSTANDETMVRDPQNLYLARAHLRHLDAEALRDSVLAISSQLDTTRGGSTIRKPATYDYGYQYNTLRRSVYVPRFRSEPFDAFTVFDCANANMVTGRREQTILPTQALFMLNSPLVIDSAADTAKHLLAEIDGQDAEADARRIDRLFRQVLGRPASEGELRLAADYLQNARTQPDSTDQQAYSGLSQMLFSSIDFRFLR